MSPGLLEYLDDVTLRCEYSPLAVSVLVDPLGVGGPGALGVAPADGGACRLSGRRVRVMVTAGAVPGNSLY